MKKDKKDAEGSGHCEPATMVSCHERYTVGETTGGLSVIFAMMCIVDLFGVFPVIALPQSVISCGVYGIPLVLSVIGLQLYTAMLLGKSWLLAQKICPHVREKNRSPYAAVADLAFGSKARRMVTFFIDATVFGSGIPNIILASQSLQLFWWKITAGQVGVTYCVWMVLLSVLLCPLMWLGSPKDMKPIAISSVFIVTTVAISTWTCIIQDDVSPPSIGGVINYHPYAQDFLMAYGILAFQFDIHPMLLTLQVDMKDSKKINSAVLGGFAFTGTLFTVTTLLAANRYGFRIDNNILRGMPPSITLYVVALLVTVQLCLSSAVSNSALFQHVEDLLRVPREFCFQRCLIRSSIIAFAVFLAESVPRFDLVMGLIGSTLTGPLMFIFPPLFFLKLCYIKSHMPDEKPLLPENDKNVIISNGAKINRQNGVLTNGKTGDFNIPLLSRFLHYKYNTFETSYVEINPNTEDNYSIRWYDVILALIVMCMGVAATIVATFTTLSDSISYATFTPPCLINATIAARSFIQSNYFGT